MPTEVSGISRNISPYTFPEDIPLEGLKVRFIGIYEDLRTFRGDLDTCLESQLCRVFKEFGNNLSLTKETDYAKRYMRIVEINGHRPNLEKHLSKKFGVFKYIRKRGFLLRKRRADPLIVLHEPFWKTRYGGEYNALEGPEIWEGVTVCAALWVTNKKKVKVIWARDRYPGTKKVHHDVEEFKLNRKLDLY